MIAHHLFKLLDDMTMTHHTSFSLSERWMTTTRRMSGNCLDRPLSRGRTRIGVRGPTTYPIRSTQCTMEMEGLHR